MQMDLTTLDPLVATLFAVERRNHGAAQILALQRGIFPEMVVGPLDAGFQELECSVTLEIAPVEFARSAEYGFEVDRALNVLNDLGFLDLDHRLSDSGALQRALSIPRRRLDPEQIQRFLIEMQGVL